MQPVLAIFLLAALSVVSCGKKSAGALADSAEQVLVSIGDSVLLRSDVELRIPEGIAPEDSARLFDALVQNWIEERLLVDEANIALPSLQRINAMVEEYRLQLLANEYRRILAGTGHSRVSEESIATYYSLHHTDLILEEPLVKGIYIKVPQKSELTSSIREWIFSGSDEDVKKLETYGLKGAMQYDDFRQTWVEWASISNLIPHHFGKPEDFLKPDYKFDDTRSGATYFLRITDVLLPGVEMPYEYARSTVAEILSDRMRVAADEDLIKRLYRQALKEKRLKPGAYTPSRFAK